MVTVEIRASLYARVSSDRQAKDNTIGSQLASLRERIAADGLTLLPELCFVDDGHSGNTLVRPALERLRDAAYAGQLERLYVLAPDRLARNYAYQFLLLEELQQRGVEVVFLNQSADGRFDGRASLAVGAHSLVSFQFWCFANSSSA